MTGTPEIQQDRRFVRGGGGELIELWPAEEPAGVIRGVVVDLAEASVRARFSHVSVADGDEVGIRLTLDPEAVEVTGRVLRKRTDQAEDVVEVIALYEPEEATAQVIRRYVLRCQAQARQRGV